MKVENISGLCALVALAIFCAMLALAVVSVKDTASHGNQKDYQGERILEVLIDGETYYINVDSLTVEPLSVDSKLYFSEFDSLAFYVGELGRED